MRNTLPQRVEHRSSLRPIALQHFSCLAVVVGERYEHVPGVGRAGFSGGLFVKAFRQSLDGHGAQPAPAEPAGQVA